MRFLKHVVIASLAGVCMTVATSALAQALDPSVTGEEAWQQQYTAFLVDSLLADGTPRSMALAATALRPIGENTKTNPAKRHELFKQAARRAPDDAWVQWLAAIDAEPADNLSEPALALQRLEPDNGAVWVFQLNAGSRANDSAGITEALTRIGASRNFDDYHGAIALEWLKFFRTHPMPEPPVTLDELDFVPLPLSLALMHAVMAPIPNYRITMQACRSGEQSLTVERREACLATGRLMLNESKSLFSQMMGLALLRSAGADDAAELARNKDYFTRMLIGISDAMLEDPQEYERYQADWLQTGSEIQVLKKALTRAGIPLLPPADWKPEPYPWMETESKARSD